MTPDRIRAIIKQAVDDGLYSYAVASASYYAKRGDWTYMLELCADLYPRHCAEYMAHAEPYARWAMLLNLNALRHALSSDRQQ